MVSVGVKLGSVLSLCVMLGAYYYKRSLEDELRVRLEEVLTGLLRAERRAGPPAGPPRVAVGFGGCQDVFAGAVDVLKRVGASHPPQPQHLDNMNNLNDVEKMFAYFFQHGAAAERYLTNDTLFNDLVGVSKSLPDSRILLGGNAPAMAKRFFREGCDVLLGTTVTPELEKEVDAGISMVGSQLEQDDVHLILEYPREEKWGKYTAPRANRFILHHDNNNPYLASLEDFSREVEAFTPNLLVVSALQMMDNFPFEQGARHRRLEKLRELLVNTPNESRIHFEMASFAEEACFQNVIDTVVYYSDSLGANEQELPNLHSMLTNGSVTLISEPYPRIATTLDHMRAVYNILSQTPETDGRRRLSRLHIHTLAYQAIMARKGSGWKNSMSAAAKASLTANRYVCGSNYIYTEKARILMDDSFSTSRDNSSQRIPFESNRPISCWEESDVEICIAPNLVCTDVVQTGGGGDNVSSAGLVLQI